MAFDPGLFIITDVIPTDSPGVRAPEKHKAAIVTCLWTSEPIRAGPLPGSGRPRVHTNMEISGGGSRSRQARECLLKLIDATEKNTKAC